MKKSDARPCAKGPFEWREGGALYVVGEDFDGETAWISSGTAEKIRASAPDERDPVQVYLVVRKRAPKDELYLVSEMVTVAGGDIFCYIDKMVMQ